jgi:Tfp pilus assembly protein PilX
MNAVRRNRRRRSRGGFAMPFALACLVVAALITGTVYQSINLQRQAQRAGERAVQAEWLAESGLERAAARLRASPEYAGETWRIAEDEETGFLGGVVVITVAPSGSAEARQVAVEARYPDDPLQSARRDRTALVAAGPAATREGGAP